MRGLALTLIVTGMLAACGQGGGNQAPALPSMNTGHFRAEATISSADGQTMPMVMYRDGDQSRMEMTTPQGQFAVVNGGASGEDFVLVTRDGETMALQTMQVPFALPTAGTEPVEINARWVGPCTGAGQQGSEWAQTNESGEEGRVCITEDGIVLRAVQGEQTVWETTSVSRGQQDPALFTMPDGVQTVDIGAMMGQMGAAMGGGAAQGGQPGAANPALCDTLRSANAPAEAISRAGC